VLRLEAEATKPPWRVDQRKVKGPAGRTCADMRYANGDADAQFITAARNIIRPLAQAYTAALTALEASDSDRKNLAARVAYLEACQRAIFDAGFKAARSMGDNAHHYRSEQADAVFAGAMERLEAELAKAKTDR
jgi:hypothetical protein